MKRRKVGILLYDFVDILKQPAWMCSIYPGAFYY